MPLTLSPPLVLADAVGDPAVVAGMASAIPAASAPVTFDFMVSPGIADTAHNRGTAHPSSPRKHWPGYWPAGGVGPLAHVGLPHCAVLIGWCLATAARRALRAPITSRRLPLPAAPLRTQLPADLRSRSRNAISPPVRLRLGWRLTCHGHETLRVLGLSSSHRLPWARGIGPDRDAR